MNTMILVGSINRRLLLEVLDAEVEILKLDVLEAGTTRDHVPLRRLDRILLGADRIDIEMGELVLGDDIAAIGRDPHPVEASFEIAIAADAGDQPEAHVELRRVK